MDVCEERDDDPKGKKEKRRERMKSDNSRKISRVVWSRGKSLRRDEREVGAHIRIRWLFSLFGRQSSAAVVGGRGPSLIGWYSVTKAKVVHRRFETTRNEGRPKLQSHYHLPEFSRPWEAPLLLKVEDFRIMQLCHLVTDQMQPQPRFPQAKAKLARWHFPPIYP